MERAEPKKGEIYEHYRTKTQYIICELAVMEKTKERVVVYASMRANEQTVWVRPLVEFMDVVDDHPDHAKLYRFARVFPKEQVT